MCGIAALFVYGAGAPPASAAVLAGASQALAHRGPDGEGTWQSPDGRVGLAHRRLAIIDLSPAADQPMVLDEGDLAIVFNGEIYNFRELKAELEAAGDRFRTASDTEVLLHLYRRFGDAMVERMVGMFAFVLWDGRARRLFMARDPLGIKPLYYADDGRTVRAASEVAAVRALFPRPPERPDPAGHAGFFLLGAVPEPHTLYAAVQALPAGATLAVEADGRRRLRRYFDLPALLAETEDVRLFQNPQTALAESAARHLLSDVPIGVFLSAGIDSAAVLSLAVESGAASQQLTALTLGFDRLQGTPADETGLAGDFARRLGIEHRVDVIGAADFAAARDDILARMDQPSIDGVNTYFVARAARRAGLKVALSGLGGDELFMGYDVFRQVPRLVEATRRVPGARLLGRLVRHALAPAFACPPLGRWISPKTAGLLELGASYGGAYLLRRGLFMPWELPRLMGESFAREGLAELDILRRLSDCSGPVAAPERKIMAMEMCWYMRNQLLRDADWAGMAHGVEIRTPLVDVQLLRALAPTLGRAHGLAKDALAGAPRRALPDALLRRPKTGFAVPVEQWLAGESTGIADRGLRGWARVVHRAKWQGAAFA
jgi:asparagine synthase (glutamine-hydrolysing)